MLNDVLGSKRPGRSTVPLGLALVAGLALAACAPDGTATEVVVEAGVVGGGPNVIATVKGGGHYQLKDPPGFVGDFKWIYRFTVNARKLADGTDEGTVRFRSHLPPGKNEAGASLDWWAEVAIDCVEIDGNLAWMSGAIVAAGGTSPVGPVVGPGPAMLIIQDNGPSGVDEINVGPAVAFGANDCRDKPAFSLDGGTDGNFTISPSP